VGISAGVGALISAVPRLQPHTLEICLVILLLLTVVNMRGVRDTGVVFLIPTYLFLAPCWSSSPWDFSIPPSVVATRRPSSRHPNFPPPSPPVSLWLLLRVFSSGCTAMTGVEAVSNGVMAFRDPTAKNARGSLTVIIALLIVLLAGIAALCRFYSVGATDPRTRLSEHPLPAHAWPSRAATVLLRHHWLHPAGPRALRQHRLSPISRLNPRHRLKGYLPHVFTLRGRRLLFSWAFMSWSRSPEDCSSLRPA